MQPTLKQVKMVHSSSGQFHGLTNEPSKLISKLERLITVNQTLVDRVESIGQIKGQQKSKYQQKLFIISRDNEDLKQMLQVSFDDRQTVQLGKKNAEQRIQLLTHENERRTGLVSPQARDSFQKEVNQKPESTKRVAVNDSLHRMTHQLRRNLQKSNDQVVHLTQSNNQLSQLLEERLIQMESMNTMFTEQGIHFQSKYDLMEQQNQHDLQILKGENTFLNEKLQAAMQLNHKYESDMGIFIADKTQLIVQMSHAHVKDKFQKKQILKLQDSCMDQEMKAQSVRMQHHESGMQDQKDNEQLKKELSRLQLKSARQQVSNAAQNENQVQHQFKMLTNENHMLKKQNLQVCNLNLELSQQVHQQTNQYEQSQTQVLKQQQQIALQNQRVTQIKRDWEDKEQYLQQQNNMILKMLDKDRVLKDLNPQHNTLPNDSPTRRLYRMGQFQSLQTSIEANPYREQYYHSFEHN